MSLQVSIPEDEEFKKLLDEALDKPDEWYEERVERAVRGAIKRAKRTTRRSVRIPRKS